ncbi:MAG: anthranilate phosphoribosyltransferase, partial [Ruminococcus sp.]|nr:anthranilate phosphoribosyltransferase [Ruminococcus sp.]
TNPEKPTMQLLGVYDESLVEPLAQVLMSLGVKKGLVVYGQDKLDEISMSAPTLVCDFKDGRSKTYTIKPEDFGFERCEKSALVGGTPEENAKITTDILKGEIRDARRNVVLMNAGAGLYIADKAESIAEGIKLAAELIDSGEAYRKLEEFIGESNK